jgi:hypothetical protein
MTPELESVRILIRVLIGTREMTEGRFKSRATVKRADCTNQDALFLGEMGGA